MPGHGLSGSGPAVGFLREAAVRCPTEPVARPVTSASRAPARGSPGRCSRPPRAAGRVVLVHSASELYRVVHGASPMQFRCIDPGAPRRPRVSLPQAKQSSRDRRRSDRCRSSKASTSPAGHRAVGTPRGAAVSASRARSVLPLLNRSSGVTRSVSYCRKGAVTRDRRFSRSRRCGPRPRRSHRWPSDHPPVDELTARSSPMRSRLSGGSGTDAIVHRGAKRGLQIDRRDR